MNDRRSLGVRRQGILSRDLLAGAARRLGWLKTPLGSLVGAAVASVLCGMFLHPQGFVVSLGIVAAVTLGLAWPWLSVRGLSGSLGFDRPRCREGEPVAARLTVRNRMPWGVWGVSVRGGFLDSAGDGRDADALVGLAHVPGRRTVAVAIDVVPGCRGVYPIRPPRLACGFPFGLWEASRPMAVAAPLLVWPRTVPVGPVPEAPGHRPSDGLATRDRPGHWGDPMGVRPYRRGDPLRRVHWGLSARHGELIVREVQSVAVPRVRIVLDVHPDAHVGSGPDGSREWAIRVAASLAEGWIGQGADVELIFGGDAIAPRGGSPRSRASAVLDALARLAPDTRLDLDGLLAGPGYRRHDGGLRVVVTTDLGLRGAAGGIRPSDGDRFVVLEASAFGGGGPAAPLPVVPWIRIDGPGRVATCLRRAGKEVALVR
jgi:uncharacterized protein (DUF58 family)